MSRKIVRTAEAKYFENYVLEIDTEFVEEFNSWLKEEHETLKTKTFGHTYYEVDGECLQFTEDEIWDYVAKNIKCDKLLKVFYTVVEGNYIDQQKNGTRYNNTYLSILRDYVEDCVWNSYVDNEYDECLDFEDEYLEDGIKVGRN